MHKFKHRLPKLITANNTQAVSKKIDFQYELSLPKTNSYKSCLFKGKRTAIVLLAVNWFRNTPIVHGSVYVLRWLHGFADVLLSACRVLMGWSSADISEILIEQREVLTPFNCWAPVMCWKTLSISCSMRLAQCIILWRHGAACHNTCKRTWRDDVRFVDSSSTSVRTKYSHWGSADIDQWHTLAQNLLAGHRRNSIHLPGYAFWLLWSCWLVCLCSNCWMLFKLKLGGETVGLWQAYPLVLFQLNSSKVEKKTFFWSIIYLHTQYILGNRIKLFSEIADQFWTGTILFVIIAH